MCHIAFAANMHNEWAWAYEKGDGCTVPLPLPPFLDNPQILAESLKIWTEFFVNGSEIWAKNLAPSPHPN